MITLTSYNNHLILLEEEDKIDWICRTHGKSKYGFSVLIVKPHGKTLLVGHRQMGGTC
jgi:hypothetical protein